MEPPITGHEAIDHNEQPVHTWRVARLTRLGIPALLAEIHADHLTGIRSPGWCSAAVPRSWPFASSADDPATHAGHARSAAR
jgi:hypothetical protein